MSQPDVTNGTKVGTPTQDKRRGRRDRRERGGPGRRGVRRSRWTQAAIVLGRDALMVAATLAAIVVSVRHTRPIFTNQPSVVQSLTKTVPGAAAVLGRASAVPIDTGAMVALIQSPQFEADRRAFAADLVATGQVKPVRADSIAYYAVREAYRQGIPPAVIFGVMLTENARFISHALSNVGAVGLMQIYPKVWLKPLGERFGKDLASDSTNLKYGAYILSHYIKRGDDGKVSKAQLSKGLLRYNGCVRGTNTPRCHTYPAKVEKYVNRQGTNICGSKGFYECIAKPFVAGFTGVLGVETE